MSEWSARDAGHLALDALGVVPVVGEAADLANAIWHAAEGNYLDAGLSLLSVIPVVGDVLGKGGKVAKKAAKEIAPSAMKVIERLHPGKLLSKFKTNPKLGPHVAKIEEALVRWKEGLARRFNNAKKVGRCEQECKALSARTRTELEQLWAKEMDPKQRGREIEKFLAESEYSKLVHTDAKFAKNYKAIDFVKRKPPEIISLKTTNTAGKGWYGNARRYLRKLDEFEPATIEGKARGMLEKDVNVKAAERVLDLRVQPGGLEMSSKKIQELVRYGESFSPKIIVRVSEFP